MTSAHVAWTAEEAQAMDRWLVGERGFTIGRLMETAGARLAEEARAIVRERGLERAVFLVGPGNNGGDALVAERLLRGELPTRLWRPLAGDAPPPLDARTLLVDGLFGVGLARPLDGAARAAVEHVNAARVRVRGAREMEREKDGRDAERDERGRDREARGGCVVLAVDIPSGLHATTGEVLGAAIRADRTLSFVGPKRGFFEGAGPEHVGAWRAVDIGFPVAEAEAWVARRRAGRDAAS